MIEETARHVGHADIIRETIDGQSRTLTSQAMASIHHNCGV